MSISHSYRSLILGEANAVVANAMIDSGSTMELSMFIWELEDSMLFYFQ